MLRIAILSMMEPAAPGEPAAAALLRVGGASVAGHQAAAALAMGCRKVIAIARGASAAVIARQHEVERQGATFRIVSGARELAALVTAQDEMLVLTEGLFAGREPLPEFEAAGHAVLVQPVEQGVAAGFERLDLNHASAGAMLIPGRLAARLAELAPDVDVISALTRIALQAGVPMRASSPEASRRLIRSDEDAALAERAWMRAQFGDVAPSAPGARLARLAAIRFGPDLLHQGKGARTLAVAAGLAMLLALGAGWFGQTVIAFGLVALAWLFLAATAPLRRISGSGSAGGADWPENLAGWVLDALVVLLVVWREPAVIAAEALAERAFAPLVLIGILRLLPQVLPARAGEWLGDRALLAVALALAALAGYLPQAVAALVLALLATGLTINRRAANAALTMPR